MDVTFSPALRVYAEMWEIAGRRRAADAQFSQALTHIRSGTPDAMAKAFDLFKRSGAHNFTEAQFAAGWCCEHAAVQSATTRRLSAGISGRRTT